MQYKPIENCQVENVILVKDYNLGITSFLFHAFTHSHESLCACCYLPHHKFSMQQINNENCVKIVYS